MRLNNACKNLFALGGVHIGSPPPTLRPLGFSFLMEEGGGSSGSNNNRIGQPTEGEDESLVDDGDGSLSESFDNNDEEVPPLSSDLSNFTYKTEQGLVYEDENGRIYCSIGHAWIGQLTYVSGQHVEIVGVNEDTESVPTEYRFLVKSTSDGTLQSHIKSSFTAHSFEKERQHNGHRPSDLEKIFQKRIKKNTTEYNTLKNISNEHILLSRDKTNLSIFKNLFETKNLKDEVKTRLIGFIIDGQVVRTCSMEKDNLIVIAIHGLGIEVGTDRKKDNLINLLIGFKENELRGGDSNEVSTSKEQARFNQKVKEALAYASIQDEDWDGRFSTEYKFEDGLVACRWQTRLCQGRYESRLSPEVKVQLTDSGLVWSRVHTYCSVDDIEDFSLEHLLFGDPSSSFRLFLPFVIKQLVKKLNISPSDPYFYSPVVGFGVPRSDVDQDQVTNTNDDVADLLLGINVEDGDDEDDDNQDEGTQVIGDVMIPMENISKPTLHTMMVRNGWTKKTLNTHLKKRELIDELITMKTLLDSDHAAYERKVEANRTAVEANRTDQSTGRNASSTMTIDEVKEWLLEYRNKTGIMTLAFSTATRDPKHKYVSRKVYKALKQIRAGVEQNEMIRMLNDIDWNTNPQSRYQEQFRIEGRIGEFFMRKSEEGVQPFDSISFGNNDIRFSNHALFRPDFTYVICHRNANDDVEEFIVFIECDEHRHDGYWRLQEHRKMTFLMLASTEKGVHNILWLRFNSAEYTDPQPNQMENIAKTLQTWNNGIDTNPEDRRGCYLKIMDYPEDHPIIQEYKDREITGDSSPRPEDWEIDEHCTREMFVSVELTNKSEGFVCGW